MHLSRRLGRAALALVASAFAAPLLSAQSDRPDVSSTPEVRRLDFNGVSGAVDLDDLKASVSTTATRCTSVLLTPICKFSRFRGFEERHYLDHSELRRDVLRIRVFYYMRGFRDAQVDTAVRVLNEKQVAVRFDVVEGPPTTVSEVTVSYDSTLIPQRRVRARTLVRRGEPLDLLRMDSTRVFFQNELWELGYADALVDTSSVVDEVSRTARVRFRLVPNHLTTVGDISITGAEKVSSQTVRNSLSFREGDVFRRSAVIESQRNLYESSLFRLATVEVPPTFDSVKSVNVVLREAPLREARVSTGFNTVDFIQTEGRFTNYNLFGGARRLELSGTVGNLFAGTLNGRGIFRQQVADTTITGDSTDFLQPTWQGSISLTQPTFLRRTHNSVSIGAFAQRRSVPAVAIDRGYGGNAVATTTIGFRATASAAYRFEVTRVEAGGPYFCVNFGVCDTTTVNTLRSHQRLSPATLQAQVDRSDVPLAPTRGYTARAEFAHASSVTASNYAYNRAFGEATLYTRFGPRRAVLATHLRLGFVRPLAGTTGDAVLHPRTRFYAGGSQSVRGFGENQLGPRILTLPHQYLVNAKLAGSAAPCDPYSDAIRLCDPNTASDSALKGDTAIVKVGDDKFTPRPLGGTSLIEGSVEYRFPLPFLPNLGGAVFVDGAAVGERVIDPLGRGLSSLRDLVKGTYAITPGFGIRYYSPVGAIRVDLGLNPSRGEELAVVTDLVRNGRREIIPLDLPRHYSPTDAAGGGIRGALSRLTLHLSIGQAF